MTFTEHTQRPTSGPSLPSPNVGTVGRPEGGSGNTEAPAQQGRGNQGHGQGHGPNK